MQAIVSPTERLAGRVEAPPSKNYTARYILAASLAEGTSFVGRPAESDDAKAMISCCRALGARISAERDGLRIEGIGDDTPTGPIHLDVGNGGAVARFIMAQCARFPEVTLTTPFPESLGRRPHDELIEALRALGADINSEGGRLPVTVRGGRLRGGRIRLSGARSSQFLTALLFLAPLVDEGVDIEVSGGLKSRPLIRQTLQVLEEAGIEVATSPDLLHFSVPGNQRYRAGAFEVPGDYPGAAALLAAACVLPSDVTVARLHPDAQGERAALDVYREMGVDVRYDEAARAVHVRSDGAGAGPLKPVDFDGDRATDAVMAMAAAAAFAAGDSRFYNVENLRYKESDRISDFRRELAKAGVESRERRDELVVRGSPAPRDGGAVVEAHHDHRIVMALSVVGLRCRRGLTIDGAEHIAKSYPSFFEHIEKLGGRVQLRR